jgi:uncharacterized membrane protein YebE (DUF533 family)
VQLKFIALLFALLSIGSIGYCLAETADNYRSAHRDFMERRSGSADYRFYNYRETMEYEVLAAGAGGLLGLILGVMARKRGGGTMATVAIASSVAGLGGAVYVLAEYNGLF